MVLHRRERSPQQIHLDVFKNRIVPLSAQVVDRESGDGHIAEEPHDAIAADRSPAS